MTSTTFDSGYLGKAAIPRLPGGGPSLRALIKAWRRRPAPRGASKREQVATGQDAGSYLAAVSNYTQFIAAHPDMPRDHRDHFLGAIIRCCEEARASNT